MNRFSTFLFALTLSACDCGGGFGGDRPCDDDSACPVGEFCLPPAEGMDGVKRCRTRDIDIPMGCVDADKDGYFAISPECPSGTDPNDDDSSHLPIERCNELDDDKDGQTDEGALNACGNCDPDCHDSNGVGPEGGVPFMPEQDGDGVGLSPEGGLILDSTRINSDFIWIANSAEGTVSRFNTETFEEEGRYVTGPKGGGNRSGNDPSRTSVNSLGDVYVCNRTGNAASRVSILKEFCPDTNGDGQITTSTDGNPLPWGQDDCVLWYTDTTSIFPNGGNLGGAIAAQDVEGPDGELLQYVWVGNHAANKIAKLNGETGEVILVADSPARPYGFALDGDGNLWISSVSEQLGRVDTKQCLDNASCGGEICVGEGACDGAVKQRITVPSGRTYGITVDFKQRVWVGGPDLQRYDFSAAVGNRWAYATANFRASRADWLRISGVSADANGFIWGAGHNAGGIVRAEADNPMNWITVPGTTNIDTLGMAVDAQGKVWGIAQGDEQAVVVTPGPGLNDNEVQTGVATSIVRPYTYSDMTGLQLRFATNPRGTYTHVFSGCDTDATVWKDLEFEADIPAGTKVSFRVRTADTQAELANAEWIAVGTAPPGTSPLSVDDALREAGVLSGRFLMLQVVLQSERNVNEIVSPEVRLFNVSSTCESVPI